MPKLARIERLIEMEIQRVAIPEELGAVPEWKVSSNPSNGKNKNHKKKFFGKKKPANKGEVKN
ncbi:hypothetical protein D3C86_1413580 [compost metagenome]